MVDFQVFSTKIIAEDKLIEVFVKLTWVEHKMIIKLFVVQSVKFLKKIWYQLCARSSQLLRADNPT